MILAKVIIRSLKWGEDGFEPYEKTKYLECKTIEEAKEKTDNYDVISVKCYLIPETPIESW